MITFFANLFGYVLNFLYEIVGNFGFAIILFSILVKILMLPISIKQQKTMQKNQKVNKEIKQIQFMYKNDPETLNQEVMALYKRENMSPLSGCLSAIVQLILLFSVFYLVRYPLTCMRKIDTNVIEKLETIIQEEGSNSNYKEIAVINYINKLRSSASVSEDSIDEKEIMTEQQKVEGQEEFDANNYIDEVYVNMDFLGIDLSKVPTEDLTNIKVLIIPVLYVITSFISIKMSTQLQQKNKKDDNKMITDGNDDKIDENDPMAQANKNMSLFMPLMSISIASIAPLGLALYWLMNNVLMIIERLVLNKFINENKEEATNNA